MPITPFLTGQAFDPEVIDAMSEAFDRVRQALNLPSGSDPTSQAVAKKVIALAQRGVRDPKVLAERVLREFKAGD